MDRLEEIKARWARATPKPWEVWRTTDNWMEIAVRSPQAKGQFDLGLIASVQPERGCDQKAGPRETANAEAIAAAPENIAWLAGEVSQLRAALAVYADVDNWAEPVIRNGHILADTWIVTDDRVRGPTRAKWALAGEAT